MTFSIHTIDGTECAHLTSLTDGEGIAYATNAHCSISGRSVEAQNFCFKTREGNVVQVGTRWIDLPRGERVATLNVSTGESLEEMSAFEFSTAWIKTIRVVSAASRGDGALIDAAIEITSLTNEHTYFQIADLHNQEDAFLLLTDSLQLNRSEVRDLPLQ